MLFDEAVVALVERLEAESFAELHICVEHGNYQASFHTGVLGTVEGKLCPVMSDALVSLIEALNA